METDNEIKFLDDNIKSGRFILAIGGKGGGKSHLLTSFLKYHLFHDTYKYIHFVAPCFHGEADGQYDFLKDQKNVNIYKHYEKRISVIVDKDRQKGKTLYLIDDASSELISNIDSELLHLITTARHYKSCTLYFAVHSCKKILLPIVRQNIDHLFIYKIINAGLLRDLYDEYFSMQFEKWQNFKDFYNKATSEKYSCIHFSIHFEGIDSHVKHWDINTHRDEIQLKPTKAPSKPQPKKVNDDKVNYGGVKISSLFFKMRKRK